MNKGFFVVFLGVVVGAMALIFINHTASTPDRSVAAYGRKETPTAVAPPVTTPAADAGREQAVATAPPLAAMQPGVPVLPGRNGAPDRQAITPAPAPSVRAEQPARTEPARVDPSARPAPVQPVSPAEPAAAPARSERQTVQTEQAARGEQTRSAPHAPATQAPAAKPETAAKPAAKPAAPDPAPQQSPKKSLALLNIGLQFKNNGIALRVEADGPFSYKTFVLPSPDRYVVDLVGSWSGMRAPKVPPNMFIKAARAGSQAGGPRLVLDLQRVPRKHSVTWVSPTVLEIFIE